MDGKCFLLLANWYELFHCWWEKIISNTAVPYEIEQMILRLHPEFTLNVLHEFCSFVFIETFDLDPSTRISLHDNQKLAKKCISGANVAQKITYTLYLNVLSVLAGNKLWWIIEHQNEHSNLIHLHIELKILQINDKWNCDVVDFISMIWK